MSKREDATDRRAPQSEGRRRQDHARPASRRLLGSARQARHADRRGPARLGARLVGAARQGRLAEALRRHRPCARHAASRGARARARRPSSRHRRAAAHRRTDALRSARGRPGACPGAAFAVRRLGVRRGAEADRRSAHLPPATVARFVLNRCGARTLIARETAELLVDHDPPALAATIGQRVASPTPRAAAGWSARSTPTAPPRARSRRSPPRSRGSCDEPRAPEARSSAGQATPKPGCARRRLSPPGKRTQAATPRGSPSTSRRTSAAGSRSRLSSAG